jgi:TolA-binding protein
MTKSKYKNPIGTHGNLWKLAEIHCFGAWRTNFYKPQSFSVNFNRAICICILALLMQLCFGICYYSFAQDSEDLISLSKQVMEAKTTEEANKALKELAKLYFFADKYNEFAGFLQSLSAKKKKLEPAASYYAGLSRYRQLRHLEETQAWDEYFSQGNNYRDQVVSFLDKAVSALAQTDELGLYARLTLWKFHKDQNDSLADASLSELMQASLAYAASAGDIQAIKDIAAELASYGEKSEAKRLYKVYVDKLLSSSLKDEELSRIAAGFYEEGNLDLAESIYDLYLERLSKAADKKKAVAALVELTGKFAYKDQGLKDMSYAEKIFLKIEELGGQESLDQELIYLRAFSLEKSKEYALAKDIYLKLLKNYPQTTHADEAYFKIGVIYAYVLKNINSAEEYFKKLTQKELLSPHSASALYQLGLIKQWQNDLPAAKEYYDLLIAKAKDSFAESVSLAQDRLNEINSLKPLEYGQKIFLDASFKEEYGPADMSRLDLSADRYRLAKDQQAKISFMAYVAESGCVSVETQSFWSGDLGANKPSSGNHPALAVSYASAGTKVINLVVISPTGILDRSMILLDVD